MCEDCKEKDKIIGEIAEERDEYIGFFDAQWKINEKLRTENEELKEHNILLVPRVEYLQKREKELRAEIEELKKDEDSWRATLQYAMSDKDYWWRKKIEDFNLPETIEKFHCSKCVAHINGGCRDLNFHNKCLLKSFKKALLEDASRGDEVKNK